ncbi:MAG: hypothetical protein AAB776_00440 [Patescibacteria group bacterium]
MLRRIIASVSVLALIWPAFMVPRMAEAATASIMGQDFESATTNAFSSLTLGMGTEDGSTWVGGSDWMIGSGPSGNTARVQGITSGANGTLTFVVDNLFQDQTLSFIYRAPSNANFTASDSLLVEWSNDDGSTWNPAGGLTAADLQALATLPNPAPKQILLPSDVDYRSSIGIRFVAALGLSQGQIRIDNVILNGTRYPMLQGIVYQDLDNSGTGQEGVDEPVSDQLISLYSYNSTSSAASTPLDAMLSGRENSHTGPTVYESHHLNNLGQYRFRGEGVEELPDDTYMLCMTIDQSTAPVGSDWVQINPNGTVLEPDLVEDLQTDVAMVADPFVPGQFCYTVVIDETIGEFQQTTLYFGLDAVAEPETADLTITKELVNAPQGVTPANFTYTVMIDGDIQPTVAFEVDGEIVIPDVAVGDVISVTESYAGPDWDTAYSDCIVAMDADGVHCVITNTYDRTTGSITINKVLVNDNGGTETVDNFDFFIDASPVVEGETEGGLSQDNYRVNEAWNANHLAEFPDATATAVTDWYNVSVECVATNSNSGLVTVLPVTSLDQNFALTPGDDIVCTITNDDKQASLEVIKLVGGIIGVNSDIFNITITDDNDNVINFPGSADGEIKLLDAGSYVVNESVNRDYVPYITGDCAEAGEITLVPGQVATCTISNEYIVLPEEDGRIILNKVIVGNDAALPESFQYILSTGVPLVANAPDHFDYSGTSSIDLPAGTTYSITEPVPLDYTVQLSDGCSGTLAAGEVVTCTVTNTFIEPLPPMCVPGNLVANAGFEAPVVVGHGGDWEIVPNLTPGLAWNVTLVGGGASTGMEIQAGYSNWTPAEGDQFAELDADASNAISQTLVTVPGIVYNVSLQFSGRPGTSAADNGFTLKADGVTLDTYSPISVSSSDTSWETFNYVFTATDTATLLEIIDAGNTSNSLGSFVDNVSVSCDDAVVQPQMTTLTVIKEIVNSDADFGEFTFFVTLDDGVPTHQTFDNDGIIEYDLPVGTTFLVVEEDHGMSWDASYEDCSGELTIDGATCTITNTFNEPDVDPDPTSQILLLDPCIGLGDDGRLIASFGYTSTNAGTVVIPAGTNNRFQGDSSMVFVSPSIQTTSFLPGSHPNAFTIDFDAALTLTWLLDWDMDGASPAAVSASASSPSCSQDPGDRTDGSLTINVVINGGAGTAEHFVVALNATPVAHGSTTVLPVGDYAVSEDMALSGYEATFSGDCSSTSATSASGNIAAGEDAVCTITNNYVGLPSGGGSSSSSGGSSGGSGQPPAVILGDTDEEEADPEADDEVEVIDEVDVAEEEVVEVTPIVAGAADELPRTGLPVAGLLAFGSVLTFMARRNKQA